MAHHLVHVWAPGASFGANYFLYDPFILHERVEGVTQRLGAEIWRKLDPILSPGHLLYIPPPVAPEWHTSLFGRQAPRLELNIF